VRIPTALLLLTLLAPSLPAVAAPDAPVSPRQATSADAWRQPLATMRQLATTLATPAIQALWPRLSTELRRLIGSEQGLQGFPSYVAETYGTETHLAGERILPLSGQWLYQRRSIYSKGPDLVEVTLASREDGQITTLATKPAKAFVSEATSPHLGYQTKTKLRLPFADEWYVFWGGRSVAQNYHAAYPDQRFAYDLQIVRQATTHQGDGKHNTDYYCYGKPVLAPGDGIISTVVDRYPDNEPGKTNPADHAGGNHVVIDHGNGEFSMLCHMQPGSLTVKAGERVKAGQPLGLTGNSGNTSEPHLHYHLQTTAVFFKGLGLPPQFQSYRANGERVSRGEPVQGQFIRPDVPRSDPLP
jgi:murein DD-endopeptidase MepM/ murein hydrolase activator NlpD